MDLEAISSELLIRGLVGSYALSIGRRDEKGFASSWASDGEWRVMGQVVRGRGAIVEHWHGLMAQVPLVVEGLYWTTITMRIESI